MPRHCLTARLLQHPPADRHDESGLLCEADELVGTDESPFRVLPPQERLEPGEALGLEAHDRLVVDVHLTAFERAVELVAGAQDAYRAVARTSVVAFDARATV